MKRRRDQLRLIGNQAGRDWLGPAIEVVSSEKAEEADCVVCVLASVPTPFPDNIFTACRDCGLTIQHRPHAPKRPVKLCLGCAMDRMRGGEA